MSVKFPDIIQHENEKYAVVDINDIRGIYIIDSLTEENLKNIPKDKRKPGAIISIVGGDAYNYSSDLISDSSWGNLGNWKSLSGGASSVGVSVYGTQEEISSLRREDNVNCVYCMETAQIYTYIMDGSQYEVNPPYILQSSDVYEDEYGEHRDGRFVSLFYLYGNTLNPREGIIIDLEENIIRADFSVIAKKSDLEDFYTKTEVDSKVSNQTGVETILFDTTQDVSSDLENGKLRYNNHDQTFEFGTTDGRKVQVNQEIGIPVRNITGTTLLNGRFVRISGYDGEYYNIEYSDNRTKETAVVDFMLSCDVAHNEVTVPTKIGIIHDVDTRDEESKSIVYLGENGMWTTTEPQSPLFRRPCGEIGKISENGEIYISITSSEQGDIIEQLVVSNIPHGIPADQKDNIELRYNSDTRELTCSGTFYYFINTKKVIATAGFTETLAHVDITGSYYHSLSQDEFGQPMIKVSSSYFVFGVDVPLAIIIYNNDAPTTFWVGPSGKMLCERHGCEMDKMTHRTLHNLNGCFALSGFAISGYTSGSGTGGLSANTFSIDTGEIYDEDNVTILPALSDNNGVGNVYNVWYKSGSDWRWYKTNLPYLFSNTNMLTNIISAGSGSLVEMTSSGTFMNMWVVGIPELNTETGAPTSDGYGIIVGQKTYSTAALAKAASFFDLDLSGFPSAEVAALWQISFQYQPTYNANGHCRIDATKRIVGTKYVSGTQGTSTSIHNNTSGRSDENCHPISAITNLQEVLNEKIVGPANSTNDGVPVYDGTTGKLLKNNTGVSIVNSEIIAGGVNINSAISGIPTQISNALTLLDGELAFIFRES